MDRAQARGRISEQRRRFARRDIQCRARIRIGTRQYAGYLQDISRGGAKLRTITPIRKVGDVILRLPDLPPLYCRLCWTDSYNAGVAFEILLSRGELSRWIRTRSAVAQTAHCEIEEIVLESLGGDGHDLGAADARAAGVPAMVSPEGRAPSRPDSDIRR
jgi:hypothetical protein